ncbi:hypothetical protein ADL06_18675 [Streptomyces sp. NRRL F-6491]|nr:hypothetical protein ADL06_18675 [Streptomyces sp. NRRL F-6491]KOX41442.1 hypothetical protein ADL08_18920 [Streptomyces sp. NRRL F-6492]
MTAVRRCRGPLDPDPPDTPWGARISKAERAFSSRSAAAFAAPFPSGTSTPGVTRSCREVTTTRVLYSRLGTPSS